MPEGPACGLGSCKLEFSVVETVPALSSRRADVHGHFCRRAPRFLKPGARIGCEGRIPTVNIFGPPAGSWGVASGQAINPRGKSNS